VCPHFGNALDQGALPPRIKTCQKFSGEAEAKLGWGHYEKRNALHAPGEKKMLYKVTSRYTAKFTAGH
jgi:hypothetical protein